MSANDKQHGGDHYGGGNYQHWDFTWENGYNQFEYCISKYVLRYKDKNGLEDLNKALHHLEKYTERMGNNPSVSYNRNHWQCTRICEAHKAERLTRMVVVAVHMGRLQSALEILEKIIDRKLSAADPTKDYVDQ